MKSVTLAAGFALAGVTAFAQSPAAPRGLTAVQGIKVGQQTLKERPTGCTVVIVENGATAGVDVRGSAPGTRETDLLNPTATVDRIHAIVLSGGSAFGLDVASGVVRALEQRGIGFKFGGAIVPIVPAAILFDLGIGDGSIRPGADCGSAAVRGSSTGAIEEGNVGAGAGATIGKMAGRDRAMKGGLGTASIALEDGLVVAALVAVNARGDIIDPSTGTLVAGMRTVDGKALADVRQWLRTPRSQQSPAEPLQHTTIGVVATNAVLTKAQASKVAQMAHDGLARTIVPAHTTGDGDAIFALATGTRAGAADVDTIGALAADAMSEAILRAVRGATGIPGYPAARDLR